MNTIEVVNNKIISNIDDTILLKETDTNLLSVNKIVIDILKDTSLILKIKNKELKKWSIDFNINKDCKLNLFELKEGSESKIQYVYNLKQNSELFTFKFNDIASCKERTIINLTGNSAKIDYHFKTISKRLEEYDFIINHNADNTISNLDINGVNIDKGILNFTITGDVAKNKKECLINEESRIINLTNNPCMIKPNLLVEEYSVSANHSAFIGKFSAEELFYLQSRGIPQKQALNLLIKGFLLNHIQKFDFLKEEVEEIINKYWR